MSNQGLQWIVRWAAPICCLALAGCAEAVDTQGGAPITGAPPIEDLAALQKALELDSRAASIDVAIFTISLSKNDIARYAATFPLIDAKSAEQAKIADYVTAEASFQQLQSALYRDGKQAALKEQQLRISQSGQLVHQVEIAEGKSPVKEILITDRLCLIFDTLNDFVYVRSGQNVPQVRSIVTLYQPIPFYANGTVAFDVFDCAHASLDEAHATCQFTLSPKQAATGTSLEVHLKDKHRLLQSARYFSGGAPVIQAFYEFDERSAHGANNEPPLLIAALRIVSMPDRALIELAVILGRSEPRPDSLHLSIGPTTFVMDQRANASTRLYRDQVSNWPDGLGHLIEWPGKVK